MNILMPMAGEGKRFREAGYTFPKPLIEIQNKMMIQWAIEGVGVDGRYIFITRKGFPWEFIFEKLVEEFTVLPIDTVTEGAACTALLAKDLIDNDEPLMIANSDQFLEWNPMDFLLHVELEKADGGILTFQSIHPKWSYVRVLGDRIVEVAEKKPISDMATCGVYYFNKGSDFVRGAEKMIDMNKRVNGEFYICPVFNELIIEGKKYIPYEVDAMHGLGTPEDVDSFNRNFNV